jgi:bifunctional polynucleotide phosphatase/kinase
MFSFTGTSRPFTGRIALFDIDGTLVLSRSGRRWAQDAEDWIWSSPAVPNYMDSMWREGWTVALMTNQSQWSKDSATPKAKLEAILHCIEASFGWQPWCFVSTKLKDEVYRKPARGMYDALLAALGTTASAVTQLQMCGDAAGTTDPFPPYQWSDSDKKFAETIGATYIRPMDVFGAPTPATAPASTQEIVLLVGNPGSGKSTTAKHLATTAGYIHVEQDALGTKAKTLKAVKDAVSSGRSVVVDATHGSFTNREPYLKLATEKSIPLRIVWHVRDGRPWNALRSSPVPEVAFAIYSKYFVDPRTDGVPVEIV